MCSEDKSTNAFDILEHKFCENEFISLYDIMKPDILLSICNIDRTRKHTINMIGSRNYINDEYDIIVKLLRVIKICAAQENLSTEIHEWITKKNVDLWKNSIECNIFKLSIRKGLIIVDSEPSHSLTLEAYKNKNHADEKSNKLFNKIIQKKPTIVITPITTDNEKLYIDSKTRILFDKKTNEAYGVLSEDNKTILDLKQEDINFLEKCNCLIKEKLSDSE
jgi:hypothetical protein